MSLWENTLGMFGLQITSAAPKQKLSGELSTGLDDEGSTTTLNSTALAGSFGTYLDQDGQIKTEVEAIRKYREMSLFAEVDVAIQEIVNESIPQEQDSKMLKLNLDALHELPNTAKAKIQAEFEKTLKLLNYDEHAADFFKKWYVDGRIAFQVIVDKEHINLGIQKLILLDSQNLKKMKDVTTKTTPTGAKIIDKVEEYFLYSETGFGVAKSPSGNSIAPTLGLKIARDAVIFCTSGLTDGVNGMIISHLNKAIRPINQLRMLEDATVVYFIARAPERRVFYVDVGNLPKLKAEQYLKDIMNRYRNKIVYDAKTGDVKNDKKYMSMLEDFWMPRRDGSKGTQIEQLPGAQNITGYLDSLTWFKEKMYESLNIPKSRLQQESGFSMGQSTSISRDEVTFQKFIDRLRNKFAQLILDTLATQLSLTGTVNKDEWAEIKSYIKLDFQKDNYFSELKEQEIWNTRFTMVQQIDSALQKYVSKEWVQRTVLMMNDNDIAKMKKQMDKEKNDESCWPDWKLQGAVQQEQAMDMAQHEQDVLPPEPKAPAKKAK